MPQTIPLPSTDAEARRDLAATVVDPVKFGRGMFKDRLWSRQEDILRAIGKPHARVTVRGCHASAKTHGAARAVLWFLVRYPDSIVVTTAPKADQLKLMLWKEIHAARKQCRIDLPEPLTIELKLAPDNYAVGFVAKDAEHFQGFHAPHLLFVIEEAPGVEAHIYEAIEGAAAGGDVRILELGNPTIVGGPFYDHHTSQRTHWTCIAIDAFDTPNLAGLPLDELKLITDPDDPRFAYEPAPWLATRRWVWDKWDQWGRHEHPLWDARVRGNFPRSDPFALVPLSWLERARAKPVEENPQAFVSFGIDVAGPGEDETAMVCRQGANVLHEWSWHIPDPIGELRAILKRWKGRIERVAVDCNGIGYHIATQLQRDGYPVSFVNVGESPRDKERFKNLKAEIAWGLRERFEQGDVAGALGDLTVEQGTSIRWKNNARGQVEIESKEDARKRGVKSPDRWEALMLAFAAEPFAMPEATGLATEAYEPTNWSDAP